MSEKIKISFVKVGGLIPMWRIKCPNHSEPWIDWKFTHSRAWDSAHIHARQAHG